MKKKTSKIWYSFKGGVSEDAEVGIYNNNDFKWVEVLEGNFEIVKKEIENYLNVNRNQIKPYFNKKLVSKKNSWLASSFMVWGWRVKKNIHLCPKTAEIVESIPGLVSYSVSILEPGAEIKPHRGDTNAIVRAHLGLLVKHGLPNCGFRVIENDISWEEGKVIVFNDAAWHKAWNNTNNKRYVLLVDVMRPEFIHKKYSVCSTVLGVLIVQLIFQKLPILKAMPNFFKYLILSILKTFINIFLRIRKVANI